MKLKDILKDLTPEKQEQIKKYNKIQSDLFFLVAGAGILGVILGISQLLTSCKP